MDDAVRAALALTPSSTSRERTVDITTTGRRSGAPQRIETWLWGTEGRLFLTGPPGRRGWFANLRAEPGMALHLKHGIRADLPATGRVGTDEAERRRVLAAFVEDPAKLQRWVDASPLVEVVVDGR